ncbi:MAG: hypothetical protein IPL24_04620 [Bacteroidetes bacterium]|nr:hypothetical protein [Bacteroidota bacterium]
MVGNPPYISSKSFNKNIIQYLSDNYITSQYQLDLYVSFIEKGISILKENYRSHL